MDQDNKSGRLSVGTPDEWTEQFCGCGWCRGGRWFVRKDPRAPELWQIAEANTMVPWAVMAQAPVCPLCGEALIAHIEGIGEPEIAIDNPFVGYIRTLKQAA